MFALCIWLTNELVDTKVCAALTTVTTMGIHVMFEQNNRTTAIYVPRNYRFGLVLFQKNINKIT